MKPLRIICLAAALTAFLALAVQGSDGTQGMNFNRGSENLGMSGQCQRMTDEVYTLTPFESVSISTNNVWQDNRHRAYYSPGGTGYVNGFLLFRLNQIPDNAHILSLNLLCTLENAFGSPSSNPVVDIYWSDDDNWTRMSVAPNQLSLNDLLVDNILFTTYIPTYEFHLNVFNHNWSIDLTDNQLCLGFTNDTQIYSYVYFYGAYGTPTGPAPVLTITTWDGVAGNLSIDLTPENPPIVIPANGGSFNYDVDLINLGAATPCHVWITATLPSGGSVGPLLARSVSNFPAGSIVNRTFTQNVPAAAPAGQYAMNAYIGVYPDVIWDSDSFNFTKSADFDDGSYATADWNSGDRSPAEGLSADNYSLSVNPNPFNPAASILINLEQSGSLRLYIYDVRGRLVSKLAEGYYSPGLHTFEFDGSSFANGVYFACMEAGGMVKTVKIILLK